MTGRELSDHLNYTGMEKNARQLALKKGLATADELAVMNIIEVCDLIVKVYAVPMIEDETILLIPKDKILEFNQMAIYLER